MISKRSLDRNYSFLGLYQKFCEADLFELKDLSENKDFEERDIDIVSMFANFNGNSIFDILYKDLKVLKHIYAKI